MILIHKIFKSCFQIQTAKQFAHINKNAISTAATTAWKLLVTRNVTKAQHFPCEQQTPCTSEWPLTTSSSAALRPKEQVRCVRQFTKDEKSSLGMAVKTFRGNTVIRLLIMLEIPTASESSISILQTRLTSVTGGGRQVTVTHFLTCKNYHLFIHF